MAVWMRSGRRGLPGLLGKSAERLGVAHGDVREHLAVDLDPGLAEAVDELGVAHSLTPGSGIDADDPELAHLPLADPAVAVGVLARAHELLVCEAVARVLA